MKDKILYEQFKKEHPETVGETDKEFDEYNYREWLEKKLSHLYSAGEEVWAWVKPEDELPPTHHIVIGIDNDGTTVAYLWWNKEDNIWRYGFEGDGNVHAPEPEFWLKQITRPTVSEEEIEDLYNKHLTTVNTGIHLEDQMLLNNFKAAIKELNR